MDLSVSQDEDQIAAAAEAFLSQELPVKRLHRPGSQHFDQALRSRLAGLGWFGLGIAEAHGGAGLGPVEEMLLHRHVGRYLAPFGILTIGLAAKVAAHAGEPELASRLIDGRQIVALGITSDHRDFGESSLSGRLRLLDADGASLALVVDDGRAALFGLEGCVVAKRNSLDKSVSMGMADLVDAAPIAQIRGSLIRRSGQLATAAMLVGIAEAVRDMIVEYAKIRQTFGRPIGAYQAVRHPCADMAVRCEAARCQLFAAAIALRDGRPDVDLQLDAAKVLANGAAVENVDWNIQLHGGIGVTDEHDAHLFLKRAQLLVRCFGSDKILLDRLIDIPIRTGT